MGIDRIHYDSKLAGRLTLALQKAIMADFSAADWHEIGHATGHHTYITRHDRLLRSLDWHDDDYGTCVYQVLAHITQHDSDALKKFIGHEKLRAALELNAPDVLHDLGIHGPQVPSVPPPPLASEVVRLALADAESLLRTAGATSAVDRLHTALHGYLRSACANCGLQAPDNSSLTVVFKILRSQHPAITSLGTQDSDIGRIFLSFATVLDSLNTLRNRASVAHPNEFLLEGDEAELVVNAVRTVFNYLLRKLG
ncbi:abortive infection family protein [Oxalobacteraceae bacterium OTU3REALA1]|nr:abortive infection family protein [Oxalobacteraceae bacterium OTU3REALA1]